METQTSKYLEELRLGHEDSLDQEVDLRVMSLGAGVQSSYVLLKMFEEEIKPPDLVIFADTGNEPKEVYEWLNHLKNIVKSKFEIEIVRNNQNTGNIIDDYKAESGRYALIPTHILKEDGSAGFGRRTCTFEYKIKPIQQRIRKILDVKTLRGKNVEMVMGISLDEIQRAKRPPVKWQVSCYPLIPSRITRDDCKHYFKHNNYGKPPRSACIVCPYHNNKEWKRLKDHYPEEWDYAVKFDEWLRDPKSKGVGINNFRKNEVGKNSEQYLHSKKIPLKIVSLDSPEDNQYSLFDDECEGICGI
jgi:hypothetical protein